MYDLLKQKLTTSTTEEDKINIIREYLQLLILKIIYDYNGFKNIAFVGGTALRILYGLRRYSEDLDFSMINKKAYNFKKMLDKITYELHKNGFKIETTHTEKTVVHSSFIKFTDLLQKVGIKGTKNRKFSIKLEIDTNPPHGWNVLLVPITESFVFAVNSFDLPSLYATKLHACFFRKYTKGRDFYDFIWYLGKRIQPNYELLNNAIKQTEKTNLKIEEKNVKKFMLEKINNIDFKAVRKDIERFIEDKNELKLLDKNIIINLIESSYVK